MEFRAEIKRTLTGPDKLRAVCSVILDDCFLVKNVRVVEGEKGLFVSLPSRRNVKGEWTEQCFPMTKELREKLSAVVLAEYDRALAEDGGGTAVALKALHPALASSDAARTRLPSRLVPEPEGAMMLELSGLSKRFGSLQALDDLSVSLDRGEIVGFVGANGAGKSTTMRIVMGALDADAGTVTWKGTPVDAAIRRGIGYMPEERGLYPRMKVAEQLIYLARLHGLSASAAKAAANQWTERLGLEERRGDEVQSLSLGNQQRVQLAAALVSSPELLILDEPFSGLDPVAVDVMSQVILERAAAGVPTLFSSHQLDVVERLCDRVVIIRSGRLVADGTIRELQATETPRWRVVVERAADSAPVQAASLNLPAPTVEVDDAGRLVITAAGADEQALLSTAQRLGTVRELGPVRHRLTEIFRDVLTTTSREGTADTSETKETH